MGRCETHVSSWAERNQELRKVQKYEFTELHCNRRFVENQENCTI